MNKILLLLFFIGELAIASTASTDLGSNILPSPAPPSGTAGGDLNGSYPNPSVISSAGSFIDNGQLISNQSATTTATVKSAAGTGASCTLSHATDVAGLVTLTTTAVASSNGPECDINFSTSYSVAPICVFTPSSANAIVDAVIQGEYFTSTTAKTTINFNTTDATGRVYVWSYHCIETQ